MLKGSIVLAFFVFLSAQSSAQLVINEASNANGTTLLDADGDSPDWIELYNGSSTQINLDGYGLSDDENDLLKWTFPNFSMNPGTFLTVFASGISNKTIVDHWETAVLATESWDYLVPSSNLASDWNTGSYVPIGWQSGLLGIGYGDWDDNTTLTGPITSVYVRKEFTIADTSKIVAALFDVDYDDGFVAYLNGVEIARSGLTGYPPNWNDLASDHEAQLYSGGDVSSFLFEANQLTSILKNGTNVLAIEVHNASFSSSDLSLIPFLSFAFNTATTFYSGSVHPYFNPGLTNQVLSTNFSIKSLGETLFLSSPAGLLIDSLSVPDLEPNMSIGKFPDAAIAQRLFNSPTPAASNNTSSNFAGFEATPIISVSGGFFSGSQTIAIQNQSTNGGVLRYTINGQEPKLSSPLYTGPITISNNTVLRVRCFPVSSDYLPSLIASESYLQMVDYTLPVISITTDPTNLYGVTGIFDNFNTDWRKPCVIEYFDKDGVKQFESRASIKPDGGAGGSRSYAQHSVTIQPAHGLYGEGEPVAYPLIQEKPFIDEYHAFYLRNGSNYWNNYPQKDATFMRIMRKSNANSQAYSPVIAYVNGEYFGVYELREKANKHYFEANYGNNPDSLDLLSVSYFYGAGVLRTVQGSDTGFYNMQNFVTSYNTASPDYFEKCHQKLDLYNFADYISAENWFANRDWVYNNMKIARCRTFDNRWRFFLQDMELGLGGWTDFSANLFDYFRYNNQPNPYWDIFDGLMGNEEFKKYFINRYADLMNTTLKPWKYQPIISDMYNELFPEMPAHFQKWTGDVPGGMATYNYHRNNIIYQLDNRTAVVREQIVTEYGLVKQVDITLDVEPAGAGYVRISTVIPEALPWTGVYFDGNPVSITAVANPGYTFVNWIPNSVIPVTELTNKDLELNVDADNWFTAVFEGAPEPATLVVSEIFYHPDSSQTSGDWIELHNSGSATIDLTGWELHAENPWERFAFSDHTLIPAGGYLVVCEDTNTFKNTYPFVANYTGSTSFKWDNKQDSIKLINPYKTLYLGIEYQDEDPFPKCADGWGRSLENSVLNSVNPTVDSWFCGCIGGSPGEAYSPCNETLIVSEINYNSLSSNSNAGDWIELYNSSSVQKDLSNYRLKDERSLHTYVLPQLTLQPGAYLVICQDPSLFSARHPGVSNYTGSFDFGFGGKDVIRLYDSGDSLIQSVCYSNQSPWPTLPGTDDYTLEFTFGSGYLDPNKYSSWFTGCEGGSPGRAYSPCPFLPDGQSAWLYPNPNNGAFYLVYDNSLNSDGKTELQVFSMNGKLVYEEEIFATEATVKTQLNLEFLAKGVYYLRLKQSIVLDQIPFVKN